MPEDNGGPRAGFRYRSLDPEALDELFADTEAAPGPPPKILTKTEIAAQTTLRDQLFIDGSDFKPTRREEIVGIDNILSEIDEIIHWLQHSREYELYGSRLQPGAIFSGAPGTGKTLVSRWIATASDALFVNVREFVHRDALIDADDIRDLFRRTRERYAATLRPTVLFWDEFENAALERMGDKSTPELRSVVSQITAELDGIHGKNEGLFLIGCTNYFEAIDAALTRRGRMGVHIEFHAPDRAGKQKILDYYLGDMTVEPDIDTHTLSYFFPKHNTAADIEEACVEAWRYAVRRFIQGEAEAPSLSQEDLVQVFIKQLVGPLASFTLPDDERMPIAIHECGHAIVALAYKVPLRLITVQPGEAALGRTMVDDVREYLGSIDETIDHLKVGLGGIAAERVAGIPAMTACTRDLSRVNATANWLVTCLPLGQRTGLFGPTSLDRSVGYSAMIPQVSEGVLVDADRDVQDLVGEVQREADAAIERVGRTNLLEIAEALNRRVTMTGNEFIELFESICGFSPELP